jgi:osmotically-inducible protein OsmY
VVNELEVTPAEQDTDAEINDAVNLVLDKDPLVHNGQIHASTDHGVVTLEGLVREPQERQMAENDVWYLSGVRGVLNQIQVG